MIFKTKSSKCYRNYLNILLPVKSSSNYDPVVHYVLTLCLSSVLAKRWLRYIYFPNLWHILMFISVEDTFDLMNIITYLMRKFSLKHFFLTIPLNI